MSAQSEKPQLRELGWKLTWASTSTATSSLLPFSAEKSRATLTSKATTAFSTERYRTMNAEEIYGPLTIPVFGSDVVYDCPNSKLMEQKKFVKFGLTQQALEAHVPLIEYEVLDYIKTSHAWKGASGTVDVSGAMSELTLFTAARSLQGKEVREKLTTEFAELYHDLDMVSQTWNTIYFRYLTPAVDLIPLSRSSGLHFDQLPVPLATSPEKPLPRHFTRQDASRLYGHHQPTPQR